MASGGSGSMVKRKITDLKVVQLRNELEKRDLDKTGFKAALIERLSKALEEEGLDPEAHEFEVPADPMSAKKTRKVAESESDHQTVDEEEEEEEKEGSSEVMDADALQLSIEDEEKLLNEEEESFDKSKALEGRWLQRWLERAARTTARRQWHRPRAGGTCG
uniref:SAP domain-containing protein n=1 Tax=Ixodes ricinus TaxID=34613 RepID=A0A6B0UYR7_IXORI